MENRLEKFKAISLKKADASADIGLINRYTAKELNPEEVYCYSVILCDNDVDRDTERFTNASLDALAPLFLGKTGLSDHRWLVERQTSRLYNTVVEEGSGKNALGEPLRVLRGSAYMLNNEANQPVIEAIDGGIMKEVSIGCAIEKCTCSICGEALRFDWRTWKYQCENGHIKGDKYDGKLCVGNLENPKDAYEFSFVAVPSQRGAGVTKCCGKCAPEKQKADCANKVDDSTGAALETLIAANDLGEHSTRIKDVMSAFQKALMPKEEREDSARILSDNEPYLKRKT